MNTASRAVFTYSQEIATGAEYYNPEGLTGEYKQFKFTKDPEHQLYQVQCPEGKQLPSSLSGRFTKVTLLAEACDKYIKEHGDELPNYIPPQPKRSHHAPIVREHINATNTNNP